MNILVLSWRDQKHPQAGGAEQVMREHMKGWVAAGHKVSLFSSSFKGCHKYEKSDGVEIFRSGDQYIGVKLSAFKFWLKNNSRFDLIVDQFHGIPFFTPLYSRKPKLAVLQEVAREVWFLNGFSFPLNYIIGTIGYIAEPLIFLFYKNVPFMIGSDSAKKDLISLGISNKKITIVPHGVIIEKLKNKPRKEKIKTIIFLGVLTKDKGIEDALKTFSILSKFGDYRFWIIGNGMSDYVTFLKDECRRIDVYNETKFWGFVDEKKKFELLARGHVLINPSVREGWGLVNIEANAVETPVIAYDSSGLIDSVKDEKSGRICKKNPEAMANTILSIINDPRKYAKLSKGAGEWSKNFDWEKSRKISIKLINEVYLGR